MTVEKGRELMWQQVLIRHPELTAIHGSPNKQGSPLKRHGSPTKAGAGGGEQQRQRDQGQ
jgi:hypothetical protein